MSRNLYNPVGVSRLPPYSVNGPTLLVMALLIATFLSSCNAPPPILSIGVLRDSESRNGEPTRRATQLAVEQVNKTGGLMVNAKKHQVQLVIMDSGRTPQQAIKAAQKLIADGVVAIIGPNSSLTALPVAGLAESVKIPFITPIATHAEITQNHKYAFRTAFSDDLQGEAMATFARKQLAAKTATVLFDISDAYSTGLFESFKKNFELLGGAIVSGERYVRGRLDFSESIARIKANPVDVIYLPGDSQTTKTQIEQLRSQGIKSTFLASMHGTNRISPRCRFSKAHTSRITGIRALIKKTHLLCISLICTKNDFKKNPISSQCLHSTLSISY
jgi:hypothetical protein